MKKPHDFGKSLEEIERLIKAGRIDCPPPDENAIDDELGEPDEEEIEADHGRQMRKAIAASWQQ